MMDRTKANGGRIDPELQAKWEAAHDKADKMAADKTQAKAGA
jgi:hypothetical protein